jgi:hypothetical protein
MEYSIDITQTYGMKLLPTLDQMGYNTVNFKKDYGLKDLRASSIEKLMHHFSKKANVEQLKNYLIDKLGFDHAKEGQYWEGLKLAKSVSFISQDGLDGDAFIC